MRRICGGLRNSMLVLSDKDLEKAVEALRQGKTVVFPTETSYGLGCDAANQEAVDKIFKIKGRQNNKPLLVAVPTVEMARKYLVWNELLEKISSHWPGPLTVVGEYMTQPHPALSSAEERESIRPSFAKEGVGGGLASGVVSTDNTIAIRVTANPIARFLSEKLGRPVVATSANLADAGDIYDPKQVLAMFSNKTVKPDILINGGELPHNPPTTIVSVINNNLKILRQGQIKI